MSSEKRNYRACGLHAMTDGASSLSQRTLHASPSVTIHEVRCRQHASGRTREEWSLAHQLVFPRSGVFVHHAGGQEVIADASQVLFFTRGEPYHVSHPVAGGDDCTVFTFDDALLLEAVGRCDPRRGELPERPFRVRHAPSAAREFLLHVRLRQAAAAVRDELALDEAAVALLRATLRRAYADAAPSDRSPRASTLRQHREQVARTKLLLSARLADDLTLAAVARSVYVSPYHLMRIFRRETGMSLHQYRLHLRLRAALERVAAGEPSLARLASELGFASHAHLSDSFRRLFGLSPAACRATASVGRLRELSRILEVAGQPGA